MKESLFIREEIEKLNNTINALEKKVYDLEKENTSLKKRIEQNAGFFKKIKKFLNSFITLEISLPEKKEKLKQLQEEEEFQEKLRKIV